MVVRRQATSSLRSVDVRWRKVVKHAFRIEPSSRFKNSTAIMRWGWANRGCTDSTELDRSGQTRTKPSHRNWKIRLIVSRKQARTEAKWPSEVDRELKQKPCRISVRFYPTVITQPDRGAVLTLIQRHRGSLSLYIAFQRP